MWRNVFISLWFAVSFPVCQAAEGTLPMGLSDKLYSQRLFFQNGGQRPTSFVPSGDGSFYGTTEGADGGTIFKISQVGHPLFITTYGLSEDPVVTLPGLPTPHSFNYTFTTLHVFSDQAGGKDPVGPLVVADGAIYGVTRTGGAHKFGTAFRMSPEGSVTTLHSFSAEEGMFPEGLMRASDGDFYGLLTADLQVSVSDSVVMPPGSFPTFNRQYSALFRMTPVGEVTILAKVEMPPFRIVGPPFYRPPAKPFLVEDGAGALYLEGLLPSGKIGILKYSKSGEQLAGFEVPSGVSFHEGTILLKGKDGNIYAGCNSGIVRITPSGDVTRLEGFNDRPILIGSLTEAANGDLYGTASEQVAGTRSQLREFVFRLGTDGRLEILTLFARNSGKFATSLVQGTDGVFYGFFREHAASIIWGSTFAYFPPAWSTENKAPKLGYDHAGPGLPSGSALPANSQVFERLNVLANDFDPEDGTLQITAVSDSRVEIHSDQTLSFRMGPNGGRLPENITYTVKDSLGATATGTIAFNNSAPVANTDRPAVPNVPTSTGTVYSTYITPLTNDTDFNRDELKIVSVSDPRVSILPGFPTSDQLRYQETVRPGEEPLGSFTYTISDSRGGVATGTVILRNGPPIARDDVLTRLWTGVMTYKGKVLTNDSDPDGDPLTVIEAHSNTGSPVAIAADGTVSVSPAEVPSEGVKIFYTVSDGQGGTASATATAPLIWVIGSPVAQGDQFTLPAGKEALLDVLANDRDPNGSELLITAVDDGGQGIVSISSNGKSLLYRPGATSAKSVTFQYTISNEQGSTATGGVTIYSPFKAARGTYHTLIGAPHGIGAVQLRLTKAGKVTGTLQFNGRRYPWRGEFNANGSLSVTVTRGQKLPALELSFSMDPVTGSMTGMLMDDEHEISLSFDEPTRTASPELAGYYTVALPAESAQSALPQGDGFALVRLRASGVVAMSGKLGDGTPFSAGSRLSHNGTSALYGRAYSKSEWKAGGLTGTARFKSEEGQTTFRGSFRWIKLPQPGARFHPAGFVGQVNATGSRSVLKTNSTPEAVFGNAPVMLELSGGNLSGIISKSLTFRSDGRCAVSPITADRLGLWLSPSTGLIFGTFRHPGTGQPTTFTGIALPDQKRAYGVFRGSDQAGSMRIKTE